MERKGGNTIPSSPSHTPTDKAVRDLRTSKIQEGRKVPSDIWQNILELGIMRCNYIEKDIAKIGTTTKIKEVEPFIWYKLLTTKYKNQENVKPKDAKNTCKMMLKKLKKEQELREIVQHHRRLTRQWKDIESDLGRVYFNALGRLEEFEREARAGSLGLRKVVHLLKAWGREGRNVWIHHLDGFEIAEVELIEFVGEDTTSYCREKI